MAAVGNCANLSERFKYKFTCTLVPCGISRHTSLSVSSISCFWGISLSLHDIPGVPKGRFKQLLVREWRQCRDQGEAVKRQSCRLGALSWFLLKEYICNNIFEPFCRIKTPNKWKNYLMKHSSFLEDEEPPEPILGATKHQL